MVQDNFRQLLNWPNAISLSRVLLVPIKIYSLLSDFPLITSVSFAIIVASDFVDGVLARKLGITNGYGTLIDHGADAIVVITLCALFAYLGVVTWMLPIIIAAAFVQYALDSQPRETDDPRPSTLGRANGIAYFIFIFLCGALEHLDKFVSSETLATMHFGLAACAWLLVVSSVISIWQRWRF